VYRRNNKSSRPFSIKMSKLLKVNFSFIYIFLLLFFIINIFAFADKEFEIGDISTNPLFGDFDDDGHLELIIGAKKTDGLGVEKDIVLLEGDMEIAESETWQLKTESLYPPMVSIGYLKSEKLFFWTLYKDNDTRILQCHDILGTLKWEKDFKSTALPEPVVWENKKKVLIGATTGKFYIFDSIGNIDWENDFKTPISVRAEIGDIDLDGKEDIIIKTDEGTIYAYNEDYEIKKGFPVKMSTTSNNGSLYNITLDDINGDKYKEIIAATGFKSGKQTICVINYKGKIIREFTIKDKARARAETYDFDRDGTKEIILVTESGKLIVENLEKGKKIKGFPINCGKTITGKPYILDTDGDRNVKIIVSVGENEKRNTLKIYDKEGKEDSSFSKSWNIGKNLKIDYFYFADIDNDGKYEFIYFDDGLLKMSPTEFPRKIIVEKLGRTIIY